MTAIIDRLPEGQPATGYHRLPQLFCDTAVGVVVTDAAGRYLVRRTSRWQMTLPELRHLERDHNLDPRAHAQAATLLADDITAAGVYLDTLTLAAERVVWDRCDNAHQWSIYRAQATGEPAGHAPWSWCDGAEMRRAAWRSVLYTRRRRAHAGLDPVWLTWLSSVGALPDIPEFTAGIAAHHLSRLPATSL